MAEHSIACACLLVGPATQGGYGTLRYAVQERRPHRLLAPLRRLYHACARLEALLRILMSK